MNQTFCIQALRLATLKPLQVSKPMNRQELNALFLNQSKDDYIKAWRCCMQNVWGCLVPLSVILGRNPEDSCNVSASISTQPSYIPTVQIYIIKPVNLILFVCMKVNYLVALGTKYCVKKEGLIALHPLLYPLLRRISPQPHRTTGYVVRASNFSTAQTLPPITWQSSCQRGRFCTVLRAPTNS